MACRVLKIDPDKPEENKIMYAVEVLNKGGVVVFPTDTVYGIGARVSMPGSIKRIYDIKKRDLRKSIIYLIGYKKDIGAYAKNIPAKARALVKRFWPGPLTLIFHANAGTGNTIGLRMPNDRIALSLIRKAGAIATTSANISGKKPISSAGDIDVFLRNKVDLIIDGGRKSSGMGSTVVDTTEVPFRVLRQGEVKGRGLVD